MHILSKIEKVPSITNFNEIVGKLRTIRVSKEIDRKKNNDLLMQFTFLHVSLKLESKVNVLSCVIHMTGF